MEYTADQIALHPNGISKYNDAQKINILAKIQKYKEGQVSCWFNTNHVTQLIKTDVSTLIESMKFVPKKMLKVTLLRLEIRLLKPNIIANHMSYLKICLI